MAGGVQASAGRGGRRGGRRRAGRTARHRPMAEINVTPLVDVMLVLLVIFMVAAPLLTTGVPVRLPETQATPLAVPDEAPLTLTLTADGRFLLQEREVPPAQLLPTLAAVLAERRDKALFLRADRGLPYGRVMEVMGALNAAGIRDIGLVTEQGGPGLGAAGGAAGEGGEPDQGG